MAELDHELPFAKGETSLLSLPPELLAKIALSLAPNGGKKVANLRLVCHDLASAAESVLWSALRIPLDANQCGLLLAELWDDASRRVPQVTSVCITLAASGRDSNLWRPLRPLLLVALRSLKKLTRLSLMGGVGIPSPALEEILGELLHRLPSLRTLSLHGLELGALGAVSEWARRVKSLRLTNCRGCTEIFTLAPAGSVELETLKISLPADHSRTIQSRTIIAAVIACSEGGKIKNFELDWELFGATDLDARLLLAKLPDIDRLIITGLPELFQTMPDGRPWSIPHTTVQTTVTFLNWAGKSHLRWLSLPLESSFICSNHLVTTLHMPHLLKLSLVSDSATAIRARSDVLHPDSYQHLTSFLQTAFPALTTLHLRGWLDASNVLSLSLASFGNVARSHPLIFGLLACLEETKVTEVGFDNGDGGLDGRLAFEREGRGAWRKRSVWYL